MGRGGRERALMSDALHLGVARAEQRVGALLHPARDVGIRRSPVRRVVFEASVLRRVVRGGDDDPVGDALLAPAVVGQYRP